MSPKRILKVDLSYLPKILESENLCRLLCRGAIYPSRFLKTGFLVINLPVPQYYDLSEGYRNGNVTPDKTS